MVCGAERPDGASPDDRDDHATAAAHGRAADLDGDQEQAPAGPCPACGATDSIPVVYGLPGGDLFEAQDRGEVALGGCVIWEDWSPDHQCRACGRRF